MPEYIYSILLVIILMIFFAIWTIRKKNDIWSGHLEKKKYKAGDEDSRDSFTLLFRTDENKRKKFTTYDKKSWDSWNEGDRATKNKGEFFPTKVI